MENDRIQPDDASNDGTFPREDDLGLAAALRFTIPVGLLLWALLIMGVRSLVA